MTSAYPVSVDVLLPQARELASELGTVPTRNRLMSHFHIGGKKATQLLDALTGPPRDTDPVDVERDETPSTGFRHDPGDVGGDATDQAAFVTTTARNASAPAAHDPSPSLALKRQRRWQRLPASWPLVLLALPAFVAIWSGWVGLGVLTGFGPVHPLPGIADGFTLNTAITLPVGVETYAAYALRVWLGGTKSRRARVFARNSAIGSLVLGAAGQVAYHLMTAWHMSAAPWPITTAVACLPVLVLGSGAALAHLQHHPTDHADHADHADQEEVSR
jgi:hypothetical protein